MDKGTSDERIHPFHVKEPVPGLPEPIIQPDLPNLFSKIYAVYLWIFSIKWYKLVFLTFVGLVIYVLTESISEHLKESRKNKKEGMTNTIQKPEKPEKKKVTFNLDEPPNYPPIYNLVVKPSMYSFFRNFGFL